MNMITNDTVVAISTGTGSSAISIVRMTGPDSVKIADEMFLSSQKTRPSSFDVRMLTLGTIHTENFNEQAMCVKFLAPKSYTGEDMIEFQCHGGTQIASGVMRECINHGARLANNGEFTKRAFLNGKTNLSSAEGMMDMISAESDAEVRAGYALLSGNLSKLALDTQSELTDILSEIEVSFDYPEETIEYITKANVKNRLEKIYKNIDDVLATSKTGGMIKSGINVLIVGKPNVGKSSLLNFLLQKDRAIVTDIAGTTRDTIEETFILDGIKINLIDTAGIHETENIVEKIGVDKAKNFINQADIVLFLLDSNETFSNEDQDIFDSIINANYLILKTKCDLKVDKNKHFENEIEISTKTGEGIETLKSKIKEITNISNLSSDKIIITNERHKTALENANKSIKNALNSLSENTLDLITVDIKQAYIYVGEITGNTTSEKIIDQIFSKFCLGK